MPAVENPSRRETGPRRVLVAALLSVSLAGYASAGNDGRTFAKTPSLKATLGGHFLVGAAIEPWELDEPADVTLLRKHFSSVTAENAMKPLTIAPHPGEYNFAPADQLVRFARENSLQVRGHTLLWYKSAPAWLFEGDPTDAAAYRALVRRRLETYITDVATHFKGTVYAWDVVNEVVSDRPGETYRTNSPWYRALGPDYIEYAFRAARVADPGAKLIINDYGTEQPAKRARLMAIVRDLLAKGVPIDGVGHQLHLQIGATAPAVEEALGDVEKLGLINHVTELDISVYDDPGSCSVDGSGCRPDYGNDVPASVLAAQAELYGNLYRVFEAHPSVKSVTTWGVSDAHTWLDKFPVTRTNKPLLFDTARAPKDGFRAIVRRR